MLNTYKAVLKGDRLEWSDEAPEVVAEGQPVPVHVTILDTVPAETVSPSRGEQMAAALERLAQRGGIADIDDPSAWQRGTRHDRDLPERE